MYSPENKHVTWNWWLEDEFPFKMVPFQRALLIFPGGDLKDKQNKTKQNLPKKVKIKWFFFQRSPTS